MDISERDIAPAKGLIAARLSAGIVQGLALYLLYLAADAKVWPATNGQIFAPLLFVALASPLGFILSVGNLRPRTLVWWIAGGTVLVAFLGWYDIWRGWPFEWAGQQAVPRIIPDPKLFVGTGAMLFIAHALIAGGDHDRRFRATYPTHFDVSWKLGVQLALALAFVVVFWGLLWLGAGLFNLVKLDFFEKLIEHRWFAIPVSALAVAGALHLADVRPSLVRGMRTLALVLLSWLLPLMAAIAIAFLGALLFTGLAPLWQTRRAASLLLVAAATLIILINATYQDGTEDRIVARPFRYAGSAAALMLIPLAALAAYALVLRVLQYGWSVDRIALAACVIIALGYACGYAIAVFRSGLWLKFVEASNFAVALLGLAVLFSYFSPIADPSRISVASQMTRLETGKTAPRKFDYAFLRWEGGRFGKAALEKLRNWSGQDAPYVRRVVDATFKSKFEFEVGGGIADVVDNIAVYPKGRTLPESFVKHGSWSGARDPFAIPTCLTQASQRCDGFLLDANNDGREDILIVSDKGYQAVLFAQQADGSWKGVGQVGTSLSCPGMLHAMESGQFKLVPPAARVLEDIAVGGQRLVIAPFAGNAGCPK